MSELSSQDSIERGTHQATVERVFKEINVRDQESNRGEGNWQTEAIASARLMSDKVSEDETRVINELHAVHARWNIEVMGMVWHRTCTVTWREEELSGYAAIISPRYVPLSTFSVWAMISTAVARSTKNVPCLAIVRMRVLLGLTISSATSISRPAPLALKDSP